MNVVYSRDGGVLLRQMRAALDAATAGVSGVAPGTDGLVDTGPRLEALSGIVWTPSMQRM